MARTFQRIVATDPPTLEDFLSDLARGRALRRTNPGLARLQTGLSMFCTEGQARRRARRYPLLGRFIAAVVLPGEEEVRFERTIRQSAGHHTVWADAATLLAGVVAVVPV